MMSLKKLSRALSFSRPTPVSAWALLLALSAASSPARAENLEILSGSFDYNICGNYTGTRSTGDCGDYEPFSTLPDPDKTNANDTTGHVVSVGGAVVFKERGVAGAYTRGSGNREATNNTVTIDLLPSKSTFMLFGGAASSTDGSATATQNHVSVLGGKVDTRYQVAAGGYAFSDSATGTATTTTEGNTFMMSGDSQIDNFGVVGSLGIVVSGGYSNNPKGTALAKNNILEFSGNVSVIWGEAVAGGFAYGLDASAIGNEATFRDYVQTALSFGGYAVTNVQGSASATGNTATVLGNVTVLEDLLGGVATCKSADAVSAVATGNHANVTGDSTVTGAVFGGRAYDAMLAEATDNHTTISGNASVEGNIYGGYAMAGNDAKANANTVTIATQGTLSYNTNVYGGLAESSGMGASAQALGNTVTISSGTVHRDVTGGAASAVDGTATAGGDPGTGNTVVMTDGLVTGGIYGGHSHSNSDARSMYNSVTIRGGTVQSVIYGGYTRGVDAQNGIREWATYNTVTIEGAPKLDSCVLAGGLVASGNRAISDAFTGNTLNLKTDGRLMISDLEGFQFLNFELPEGLSDGDVYLTAKGLSVKLFADLGGYSISSQVTAIGLGRNQSVMPGDTIRLIYTPGGSYIQLKDNLIRDPVESIDANGLTTEWKIMTAGSTNSNYLDALFIRMETEGDLSYPNGLRVRSYPGENVTLKVGGTLSAGDGATSGLEIDNSRKGDVTVDIGRLDAEMNDVRVTLPSLAPWNGATGVRFQNLILGGGKTFTLTGLGAYRVDAYEVRGASTFDAPFVVMRNAFLDARDATMRFNALAMNDGDTMLTATGGLAVDGARIEILNLDGRSSLMPGHRVILADSTIGVDGDLAGDGHASARSRYVQYDGLVSIDRPEGRLLFDVLGTRATPEGESLSNGPTASGALVSGGGDFVAQQGLQAAREQGFGTLGARGAQGTLETSPYRPRLFVTLGGSQLRYDTGSRIDTDGRILVTGAATGFATATGDATLGVFIEYGEGDYTSRNAGVKGKGHTRYRGGGLLGRFDTTGDTWFEGSLRSGIVNTDNRGNPQDRYDTRSRYFGAHLGVGKQWTLDEREHFDTYAQVLWTRQGKDSATLPDGQKFRIGAIDSRRLKIGTRLNHRFSDQVTGFVGVAYDYEFSDKTRSQVGDTPKFSVSGLKGGSGIIEAGLSGRPTKTWPLYLDGGIQSHTGKREGITAHVRVNYFF